MRNIFKTLDDWKHIRRLLQTKECNPFIKSLGDPGFRSNQAMEERSTEMRSIKVGEHIKEFAKQFSSYFTAEYYILSGTKRRGKQKW